MRIIDSSNLGNTAPAQTGRTGEVRSIDSGAKSVSGARKVSSASDSVNLSSFSERIGQTMANAETARSQRVAQIGAAVRSGTYQVDANAVSHSLVNHALMAGSDEAP